MARPIKDGVDYFPKDTGFYQDAKVRLIRARYGAKGMYLLDYLLCEIYGKRGYYMDLDKNTCYLVSDGAGCGCSPNFVGEVIHACLSVGIFDETCANVCKVLTSAGIQRRYIRMFNSRDAIYLIEEYLLLDKSSNKDFPRGILEKCVFQKVFGTENPNKTTENPDKSTGNPQSKVKENKVKENIATNVACPEPEESASGQTKAATPPVITLPLNDKSEHPVCQADVDVWQVLYPSVNVMQELRNMKGWLMANPAKRKTKAGIQRFINSWLSREQNQSGRSVGSVTSVEYRGRQSRPEGGSNQFLDMLKEMDGAEPEPIYTDYEEGTR